MEDRFRFCKQIGFDEGLTCLQSHSTELAATCKAEVDVLASQLATLHSVCDNSIAKICPAEAKTSANETAQCLVSRLSELEAKCLSYISTLLQDLLFLAPSAASKPASNLFAAYFRGNRGPGPGPRGDGDDGQKPMRGPASGSPESGAASKVGGPLGAALIAVSVVLFVAIIIIVVQCIRSRRAQQVTVPKGAPVATAAALAHIYPYAISGHMEPGMAKAGLIYPPGRVQNEDLVGDFAQPSAKQYPPV
jgi:hypothetical protein